VHSLGTKLLGEKLPGAAMVWPNERYEVGRRSSEVSVIELELKVAA
jgi:hypothetical protein